MTYQIMYSSQSTLPMSLSGLEQIIRDARSGNEARNVTGALVYVEGVFFQILEGSEEVVRSLMANIARDSRHHSVKTHGVRILGSPTSRQCRVATPSAHPP